jgi:hypothetical protein
MELLVVLAVATILAGLLLPAMAKLRENVHRVICASNQRQIGVGLGLYTHDHHDFLPPSAKLDDPTQGPWKPQEQIAAHLGGPKGKWDGLGILFYREYCGAVECFYCPSHRGDHPAERYIEHWHVPNGERIYMNYHYAGHRHWEGEGRPRLLRNPDRMVLATDGLRTASDFNHEIGMNILYGDASVRWSEFGQAIVPLLPDGEVNGTVEADQYKTIWRTIEGPTGLPDF